MQTVSGEQGYTSESVAQVSVPRHDHISGLNVKCLVTNEETGTELSKEMTLSVQCKWIPSLSNITFIL